jgi:hypothetical protein
MQPNYSGCQYDRCGICWISTASAVSRHRCETSVAALILNHDVVPAILVHAGVLMTVRMMN